MSEQRNASDEEQVEQAREREKRVREQELEDFRKVMGEAWGRRFVRRLLDKAGIDRISFTGNSTTFFNEGMRNMGLIVKADLETPELCELYFQMIRETINERNSSDG